MNAGKRRRQPPVNAGSVATSAAMRTTYTRTAAAVCRLCPAHSPPDQRAPPDKNVAAVGSLIHPPTGTERQMNNLTPPTPILAVTAAQVCSGDL